MTPIVKPSNSNYLSSQVSQYVAENYPQFLEFFQAYYDWLDTVSPRNFENIIDLDDCPEQFIQYYLAMYNPIGQNLTGNSAAHSLANIRKFYATKGTSASFSLLFYMLFGNGVNILYPSSQIFKASSSAWIQQKSIFVTFTDGNPYSLSNTNATVSYNGVNYSIGITDVSLIQDNLYELFVDTGYTIPNNAFGNSTLSSNLGHSGVITGTIDGTIENSLGNHTTTITTPGAGFNVGDIFYIYPIENSIPTIIKIIQVSASGGITSFEIIKFGSGNGYAQPFNSIIYPNTEAASSVSSSVLTDNTYINNESGYVYESDYFNINTTSGYASSTYSGDPLSTFYTYPAPNATAASNFAAIKFGITSMTSYPGQFSTATGMLSNSASVLQDSYYYQQFSYVLESTHTQDEYDSYVKSYLHPAGMKRFSIYKIENSVKLIQQVSFNIRNFEVELNDSDTLTDTFTYGTTYSYTDNVDYTETLSFNIRMVINDSTTMSESSANNVGMIFTDNTTSSDITNNIQDNLAFNDSVSSVDNITSIDVAFELSDSTNMSSNLLLSFNAIAGIAIAGKAISGVN